MSEHRSWLSASQLSDLLRIASAPSTEQALIEGLSKGHISAKSMHADFVAQTGRVKSHNDDWNIPRRLWSHPGTRLDLAADRVRGRVAAHEGKLIGLFGAGEFESCRLMFDEAETRIFLGLPASTAIAETRPRKRGRAPASAWPIFAAALAVWVERKNDTAEEYAEWGPDQIWKQVDSILTSEWGVDLPRSTFMPAIQEFLQRMSQEAARRK